MSNVYWTTQNEINSTSVTEMSDMMFHNVVGKRVYKLFKYKLFPTSNTVLTAD